MLTVCLHNKVAQRHNLSLEKSKLKCASRAAAKTINTYYDIPA